MTGLDRDSDPLPAKDDAALHDAADRIEAMLAEAQFRDAMQMSTALRSDPARAELRAILAQLEQTRLLPILHRLAMTGVPHKREVLEGLLAANASGSGQTLRSTLQALHRRALLVRIFHPDRVQALRRICQSLTQEPA